MARKSQELTAARRERLSPDSEAHREVFEQAYDIAGLVPIQRRRLLPPSSLRKHPQRDPKRRHPRPIPGPRTLSAQCRGRYPTNTRSHGGWTT